MVNQETILKLFEQHNAEFENKYAIAVRSVLSHATLPSSNIREFLPSTYPRQSIAHKELNLNLSTISNTSCEKKYRNDTVWGYIEAYNLYRTEFGFIAVQSLCRIHRPESVDRRYLTKEEIQTLMRLRWKTKHTSWYATFSFFHLYGLGVC